MNAAGHRPLLVKLQKEGYRVCDICYNNEQKLEVGPLSLSPALTWVDYKPLAVSPGGTCLMGLTNPPAGGAHNTDPPPIMLPVGDDTMIRMDMVIYGDPFSSRFEMLRRLFPDAYAIDAGGWFTVPLPRPPLRTLAFPSQSVYISSYFVMGTSVWISVTGEGTFSLDARSGVWRMEFPEELRRLEGRAFFAPELDAVVGLTGGDRLLCAYKFGHAKDGSRTLTWHNTWREALPSECFDRGYAPRSDMVGLAYLGDGRFCICRPVRETGDRSGILSNMYTFLVLELRRRLPDGEEIELARRGEVNCQGIFDEGYTRDIYFIQ